MPTFNPNGARGITVYYDSWMEGGGTWFGQEYIDIVRERYPNRQFKKCYEWCSGPGFIGFGLLDHELCENICLSDIYESAIDRVLNHTAKDHVNQCEHQVSAYATGTLHTLPDHEQFDLVVANPPHFLTCPGDENMQRIKVDGGWAAHRDFFRYIGQHLLPDGVILLQENQAGSIGGVADFEQMIKDNGLIVTDSFRSPKFYEVDGHTQIYYIEIKKAQ